MKALFFGVLAALLLSTGYMVSSRPKEDLKGRTRIYWATDANPLRDEQIKLFNDLNPKLSLALDPNNGVREKVIVQSLAGVGPDVFDYWGAPSFEAYVQSGVALDLTDELKKRGFDYEKIVWPLALPWTVKDGRVYGVPANVGTDGVWFHKEMFDKVGLPYPKMGWTINDFIETAKKLTIRDSKGVATQYGALIDVGGLYNMMLASYGGRYWSDDGKQCLIDSPESIACLTMVRDLLYKYKVAPTPQDENSIASGGGWGGSAGPMAYFRRKTGAMAVGGRWWLAQLRDDIKLSGFKLGSVSLPIAKYPVFSGSGARSVMVNAFSPHRKEALEFIFYLLEPPYNDLLNDQADALSAVKSAAYKDRYEHNPRDPGQDFHLAFRKSLEMGKQLNVSPYLPQSEFEIYLNRQLDLVKLNMKSPEKALKDAKRDLMDAMNRWVSRHPQLAEAVK